MIPRRRGNTIGRLQIGQSQIVHEIGNVINYMGFSIHYLIGNGVTDQFPFQNSNPWLSTLKVRLHFRAVTSEPKPGMHLRLPRYLLNIYLRLEDFLVICTNLGVELVLPLPLWSRMTGSYFLVSLA